jgi:hypothetical protein
MSSWADMFKKASSLQQIGVIDDDDDHANTNILTKERDDCGIGQVAQLAASFTESKATSVCCPEATATKKRKLLDVDLAVSGNEHETPAAPGIADTGDAKGETNPSSIAKKKKRKKKKKSKKEDFVKDEGEKHTVCWLLFSVFTVSHASKPKA